MSAVLTSTNRRGIGSRLAAWLRAKYVRFLIAGYERDVAHLEAEIENLPDRIDILDKRIAELRVDLALLEKS